MGTGLEAVALANACLRGGGDGLGDEGRGPSGARWAIGRGVKESQPRAAGSDDPQGMRLLQGLYRSMQSGRAIDSRHWWAQRR
jgi:hypothetical protein